MRKESKKLLLIPIILQYSVVNSSAQFDLKPKSSQADKKSSQTKPNHIGLMVQAELSQAKLSQTMKPMEPMVIFNFTSITQLIS